MSPANKLKRASLVAQQSRICLPKQEMWVWSRGQEDPLEKEVATRSRILAWQSHGQRSLVGYGPWGPKELDTTEWLNDNNELRRRGMDPSDPAPSKCS